MDQKTKVILLSVVALLMLVWGLGMKDGDKDGGYSDETTYFSKEEVEAREKTIAQMAQMRGETPSPSATPEPEKKDDELDEQFGDIQMQELPQSFTLSKAGYDPEQQIMLAEFNMTGLIYAYYNVPQEEWDKLMASENFDKWFEFMIMKKYDFEQLN